MVIGFDLLDNFVVFVVASFVKIDVLKFFSMLIVLCDSAYDLYRIGESFLRLWNKLRDHSLVNEMVSSLDSCRGISCATSRVLMVQFFFILLWHNLDFASHTWSGLEYRV